MRIPFNLNKAIDAILKGVTYLIDKAIQKAPFDRIVSGIIVSKDGNTATLLINGVTYTKVSSIVNLSNLKINDTSIEFKDNCP